MPSSARGGGGHWAHGGTKRERRGLVAGDRIRGVGGAQRRTAITNDARLNGRSNL